MGLFDYIRCEYPLPNPELQDAEFQTKDTEAQYLDQYRLTQNGRLLHQEGEPDKPQWVETAFHGDLTFYISNVCGSGPVGYMTRDGMPAWSAEYTALFDHGRLLKLEGGKTVLPVNPQCPLLSREEFGCRHNEYRRKQEGIPYPTLAQVDAASLAWLAYWNRFLLGPAHNSEKEQIWDRIRARWGALGGASLWTTELDAQIGRDPAKTPAAPLNSADEDERVERPL